MPGTVDQLAEALRHSAQFVEQVLDDVLPQADGPESRVTEAMRYAMLGGGKRLRPFLVLQTAQLCGVPAESAARTAAAVECVHVYSLVHDDLPAMDNDDLRRGKPTVHKAFDEATAILAGDGLLTLAFGLLGADATHADPGVRCRLVVGLAQAIGHAGMIGGQAMDILLEGKNPDLAAVKRLQRMKTGALLTFSCEAGAILGNTPESARQAIIAYGQDLGVAFQITDDLLDAEGDSVLMGKAARKDAQRGKPTMVAALGLENARKEAEMLAGRASARLDCFGEKADLLRELAVYIVQRRT
ncbi:MAG TPA: farnesyl diphosphate synthase [Rhizomicrobium sp.]|jgi:farnesyl diphosphate synthase